MWNSKLTPDQLRILISLDKNNIKFKTVNRDFCYKY